MEICNGLKSFSYVTGVGSIKVINNFPSFTDPAGARYKRSDHSDASPKIIKIAPLR